MAKYWFSTPAKASGNAVLSIGLLGRLGDVVGRVGDDLDLLPVQLAEEHVAEGAGVPDALDRDAVRPEQVIDERPLLVGALELELDLEPVGVLEEPEGLGDDHAALGRGRKTDRLAGDGALVSGSMPVTERTILPVLVADDFPEHRIQHVLGFGRGLPEGASCRRRRRPRPSAAAAAGPVALAQRQRQRRRPVRVAADELERTLASLSQDIVVELGVVTRRVDRLDAGTLLLELDLEPIAPGRFVGGRAEHQLRSA